ncbi:MAG: phosphatidate cytidylyltransferase [Saprospirales bacterium]|nr:phosphatidate cytidylyltransferase [Saprospirales bacterium]
MNTLMQRSLTALLFGIVMIGGIWIGSITFGLLFLAVAFMCLWEFFHLVSPTFSWREGAGISLGLLPFAWELAFQLSIVPWQPNLLAWLLLFSLLTALILILHPDKVFQQTAHSTLATAYLGLPFYFLLKIAFLNGAYHPELVFGILLLTWANDTGAYFVGSRFGKRKLFPSVSPKKTWEGTIGGVLFAILAGWGIYGLGWFDSLQDGLVLGAIVGITGTVGDLVESSLKRSFQVKDSGSILPGHGGVLDRFDSFVFLLPWVAGYLLL